VAAVREGDVVELGELDVPPKMTRAPTVVYPPVAARSRIETSVIVTALVSESGDVLEVRVLRGDSRFGFNDAAIRAIRNMRFSPPMKDGKRVKTWFPQTVNFRL
ncbi:MAG TPA: energy transducer TonB, partial [Thermoanaerobaculia bacterium]|nr:energy transducer TonB [Thermoanaerobaculia bacterium]